MELLTCNQRSRLMRPISPIYVTRRRGTDLYCRDVAKGYTGMRNSTVPPLTERDRPEKPDL